MQPELFDTVPPIDRLANDLAALRKNVADLMRHIGQKQICTGPHCRREIYFVVHHDTGRTTPYNLDGSNHFITCVDRELFQRRKTDAANSNRTQHPTSR